ncbi:MAG: hypothetical protein APF76_09650 [Desulfitibacter sp. BRH_c19]|nr:MAG: hypothetical protein APF76_09650 [Desulfitibacter sp. BRH_c19]
MKKGKFRFLPLLIVFALLFVVLGGCGQNDTTPEPQDPTDEIVNIQFTNWVSLEEGTRDNMQTVMENFHSDNPNIKAEVIGIPVSDTMQQITIMAAGGNSPDVSQVQGDAVITLAAGGFLEPLDDIIPKELLDKIPQSILDGAVWEGKLYAVPWAPVVNGFWYNKTLMEEAGLDPNNPPKTIVELDQAIEQARGVLPSDVTMIQLDTTVRTIGLFHQWPFMMAFNDGAPPVDMNGNININTPGMVEYGEWVRKHMEEGNSQPGKKYGEFRPAAADNKLLFGFDGSYLSGVIQALNTDMTEQDVWNTWGVTTTPTGSNGVSYVADTNHSLVVFKQSANKDSAMKLIEYLVNSESGIRDYILPVGYAPVTSDAIERFPQIADSPITTAFMEEVLPSVVALPYGPDYNEISEIIMTSVQEIISTDKSIEAIWANAESRLQELLQ